MELERYLTILSWVVCPLSFIILSINVWWWVGYNDSLQQTIDLANGKRYSITIYPWFTVFLLTLSWLIAN